MPLRNTLVRLALSLAALILCPQPADAQQPPPSAWSIGGTVGFGYAGGEGASVMRLPWLLGLSLQRRIGDRPWWVGIEAIRLRARPTSAGMDTLRAGAPGDLTHAPGHLNDVQTGHYDTGIVEGLVRYDVPSQGVLAKYALAGLGLATTTGFLCNSSECAAGDGDVDLSHGWYGEFRKAMMIGGGVSLRLADVSPQVAVPVMLYGEVRLVNVGTRHGGMFVTPVLIGVSIWSTR
jgi:hypothetical protein